MNSSITRTFVFAAVLGAARLSAANFVVTSLADSGPGSLREQLRLANTTRDPIHPTNIITIAVKGTITLLSTIAYDSGSSLAIEGNGGITISGGQKIRPFFFNNSIVLVQNLTIANGAAFANGQDGLGGAIYAAYPLLQPGQFPGFGLTLREVTFDSNRAIEGGAVYFQGGAQSSIIGCTFVRNTAQLGGAIKSGADSDLTIGNSTFAENKAQQGGAIAADSVLTEVSFSTIAGNMAIAGGGIYQVKPYTAGPHPVSLNNTIVAFNGGGNCGCPPSSSACIDDDGGNLTYPDSTCPGTVVDPKLGPLSNNGGFTATIALQPGSPAIDAASGCLVPGSNPAATDQRGVVRPQGARCDIGAYEYSPVNLRVSASPIDFAKPITLTASILPLPATGSFTFYDGVSILGTAPLNSSGSASLTTRLLPMGTRSLRARYSGDSTHLPGFSQTLFVPVRGRPAHGFVPGPANPHPVGLGPFAIALANFTGSPLLDLAIANAANASVSVLSGAGSGGFMAAPHSPYTVGIGPFSLAAGDFNGDGWTDLAVANDGDNTISILINNGGNGFLLSPVSLKTGGGSPVAVRVADVNGDGKADLVVANAGDGSPGSVSISVLLGDGKGNFTLSGAPVALPSSPTSLEVADFNGDGIPDAAVATSDGHVRVLMGVSAFGGQTTLSSGSARASLAAGDLNGDGKPDLVVADLAGNRISVWLGDGAGGFSPAPGSPFAAGHIPQSVAIGDMNGDGVLDLVVADSDGNDLSIFQGYGDGSFRPAISVPAGITPFFVVVGDFNGDSIPDLAVANFNGKAVTILLGMP
jgi:predicted outer membrane repeat protein